MENNNNNNDSKEKEEKNNEIKDIMNDNESENDINIIIKEEASSNGNNNSSKNINLIRGSSEIDLDKIIAGKDEGQSGVANLNDIIENVENEKDSKDSIDNDMDGGDIMNKSCLNDLFIDVLNKKIIDEKDKLRMSIFKYKGTQNVDFWSIINAQLKEIKNNTVAFFDKTIKIIEKRYTDYYNKINNYIQENELKISKVFQRKVESNDNILEFADNNIFKQFDNVIEIHENIMEAIKDHIKLLSIFLQTDLIQQKNPLEYFINNNSNDILKCWFLNKINFQKINLSTVILNKDLSELCSNYLCKKKDNSFSTITIKKDNNGNLPVEANFVKDNLYNLEKLKFANINSEEMNSIFKSNNEIISDATAESDDRANKLRSLSIIDSNFSNTNIIQINPPYLQKLKIKKTPFGLSMKYFYDSLLCKTSFLQYLYLQKCYLDDLSLSQTFEFLSNNKQMLESLISISFSGNEINTVDINCYFKEKEVKFTKLQYLDFSKNNIYEFVTDNYTYLPELKVLDLTDNNISNYLFFKAVKSSKYISSIALLSNNIFINNNRKNANDYRKYFFEKISVFEYKIKKLNLTFLYNKESINNFLNLTLSPTVKISLKKLNLSYCGLTDENICNFLHNNFGFLNLKELNLSNNFITINLFNLFLKLDISIEKLSSLDLSMNDINTLTIKDYKNLEKFLEKHLDLKKIKFQYTSFLGNLILFHSENPEFNEINKNLIKKGVKFVVESECSKSIASVKDLFEIKDKEF